MSNRFEIYAPALRKLATELRADSGAYTPVGPICRKLGVESVKRKNLSVGHSLLVDAGSSPKILLRNRSETPAGSDPFTSWERFLIAHELGHLLLRKLNMEQPAGRSEYWQVETLCDAFARQLLIPEQCIRGHLSATDISPDLLLQATFSIAEKAKVPWSAAAHRVGEFVSEVGFFKMAASLNAGYRVTVSTLPYHRGRGQKFHPGSELCQLIDKARQAGQQEIEIRGSLLEGIRGLNVTRGYAVPMGKANIYIAVQTPRENTNH